MTWPYFAGGKDSIATHTLALRGNRGIFFPPGFTWELFVAWQRGGSIGLGGDVRRAIPSCYFLYRLFFSEWKIMNTFPNSALLIPL